MKKGSKSENDPLRGDAVPDPAPKPPPVLLTKRAPVAPPDPKAPREKICAECGMHFRVESGEKFYLCPDCYRRSFVYKRKGGPDAARILTKTSPSFGMGLATSVNCRTSGDPYSV